MEKTGSVNSSEDTNNMHPVNDQDYIIIAVTGIKYVIFVLIMMNVVLEEWSIV